VTRPRLTASVIATAVAATAMIMSAPGADAATVKTVPARAHVAKAATLKPATPKAAKTHTSAVRKNSVFYDSITPSEIPDGKQIATYADGNYAADRSSVSNPDQVIWIDVSGRDVNADVLDVEPGDARPSEVARWVKHRLTAHPSELAIVYTMRSEWAAAKASVATLPASLRSHVRWWIADPTGHPHIVPGSQATQWYWGENYDISTALPSFTVP
jgi:hypothetical protein